MELEMPTATKKSSTAKSAPTKTPKRTMTADHKAKLAQGRTESRIVSKYLEALSAGKGKRGRKRTPESINMQITKLDREMETASAIRRLELTQMRFDLEIERERLSARVDIGGVEKEFVKIAKSYAKRTGIGYNAFRSLGVPAEILKKAGITRARS